MPKEYTEKLEKQNEELRTKLKQLELAQEELFKNTHNSICIISYINEQLTQYFYERVKFQEDDTELDAADCLVSQTLYSISDFVVENFKDISTDQNYYGVYEIEEFVKSDKLLENDFVTNTIIRTLKGLIIPSSETKNDININVEVAFREIIGSDNFSKLLKLLDKRKDVEYECSKYNRDLE